MPLYIYDKPIDVKNLITLICLCFVNGTCAQEADTYKSLNVSIGAHVQTPNSLGFYGTWEKDNSTYLYTDLSVTLGKYTYYDNISYNTARYFYEDEQLDDYPDAISLNIGYLFNDNVEQIRPFVYVGINGGTRHVGFRDETRILSTSGNYSVSLPNSGYTKLNIGGGIMIPFNDSGELKISADANPPSLHVGIGLTTWSKARKNI